MSLITEIDKLVNSIREADRQDEIELTRHVALLKAKMTDAAWDEDHEPTEAAQELASYLDSNRHVFDLFLELADLKDYTVGYYHCVCSMLTMMIDLCEDVNDLKNYAIDKDIVGRVEAIWNEHQDNKFLTKSCLFALMILFMSKSPGVATEVAPSVKIKVFEFALQVLEAHEESPQVFDAACDLIGCSFTPEIPRNNRRLFTMTVSLVWGGVTRHAHDQDAQATGRELLRFLVGPETARQMIDHSEMHHCENCDCSGAA